jgi:hypothetical protein
VRRLSRTIGRKPPIISRTKQPTQLCIRRAGFVCMRKSPPRNPANACRGQGITSVIRPHIYRLALNGSEGSLGHQIFGSRRVPMSTVIQSNRSRMWKSLDNFRNGGLKNFERSSAVAFARISGGLTGRIDWISAHRRGRGGRKSNPRLLLSATGHGARFSVRRAGPEVGLLARRSRVRPAEFSTR